ncbi:phage virion morphogenesis protein [Burkholderia gladioli]|uniref:phage virion morphogenesis protein n=1 Tax=Burkholderia gladioli TaxID=28095 RepID=UPI001640746D|nr:phage virion morphogenesis protein [Burkholderia gladioli]
MAELWDIVVDIGDAQAKLDAADRLLGGTADLYRGIAGVLESVTEGNFAAQGRPAWVPLAESTKAERLKRNKGSSTLMILQDRGILAGSVSSQYGSDFALIGAGGAAADYAGAHQFGVTITHPAHSTKVRLRTDAKGNLERQPDHKNLAVFARNSHKRVRESWHEVGEYTVTIPARPYLPFSGPPNAAVLQPEAETGMLELVDNMLRRAFG